MVTRINISNYDRLNQENGILERGYSIIYAIVDKCGKIKYIGKTVNLRNRIKSHINEAKRGKTKLYNWMRKHKFEYEFVIMDICKNKHWKDVEKSYIKFFKKRGVDLLNTQAGGQGIAPGHVFSDKTRKKQSESAKLRVEELNQSKTYECEYASLDKADLRNMFHDKYHNLLTNVELSEKYNIAPSSVSEIFNGKRYKHLAKEFVLKYTDYILDVSVSKKEARKNDVISRYKKGISPYDISVKTGITKELCFRYIKDHYGKTWSRIEKEKLHSRIIDNFNKGIDNVQSSKILGCDYTLVWRVINNYKAAKN